MISHNQTQQIAERMTATPIDETTLATFRQEFPEIHFTYCMDDDIPNNEPIFEAKTFNLYLVDGREHCLSLTNDHEVATGIVVAEVIED